MRQALIGSLLVLACAACDSGRGTRDAAQSAQRSALSDFTFQPGVSFGALTADGSEQDLVAAYGAAAVQPEDVSLGEGESEPGTVVFPDDPLRRFEVAWGDTLQRRAPSFVLLTGDTTLWHGRGGLTLGISLAQLEALNGKAFGMAGYGWDYGGSVLSWKDGQLADLEGRVAVALAPRDANPDLSHVLGDGEFMSSDSALQRLQPRVNRLVVRFE